MIFFAVKNIHLWTLFDGKKKKHPEIYFLFN